MFANTFQSGFVSIFYSVGSKPLEIWDKQVKNGHIRRIVDDEVKSLVLEVAGTNVATTYITCPIKPRLSLGIRLPFLVMIIKNMKKYFTFEIQILDDKDMHRRFRVSNFQSTTKVRPFCTTMPIGLSSGWNQIQFNLADFTKRAYGSTYLETTRVQIHANARIRRIYFSDVLYTDEELPNEYKLFLPTPGGARVSRSGSQQKQPEEGEAPKRESKKLSAAEIQIQLAEEEIPSGAPPSPAGPPEGESSPQIEAVEEPIAELQVGSVHEVETTEIAEPPTERTEESAAPTDTEPTTEITEVTETTEPSEALPPAEAPPAEAPPAEEFVDASAEPLEAPKEEVVAEVQPAEAAAPPQEQEEAPPVEEPVVEAPPPVAEAPPPDVEAPPPATDEQEQPPPE